MKNYLSDWLCLAILALTVALLPAHAAETSHRVTFVHSYSKATSCHKDLNRGLADGLEAGGVKAAIDVEYLGVGVGDWYAHREMMEEICRKARAEGSDVLVTVSGVAANALLACDDPLLQEIPVICVGAKAMPAQLRQHPNVCGFTVSNAYTALLDEAVRVFPDRKGVRRDHPPAERGQDERHSHPVPQHLGRRTPTPVAAHDHGRQRHLQLAV